jgi:hypothetical protein
MKLSAECYSGRKAGERPIRFWLAKFEPMTGISIFSEQTSTADDTWDLVSFATQERSMTHRN